MSNTVNLNANSLPQTSIAVVAITENGSTITPDLFWSSSNTDVAIVQPFTATTGRVTGVPDPSGTGTKTATITASYQIGGQQRQVTGTANVTTIGDSVVATMDFGPPTP